MKKTDQIVKETDYSLINSLDVALAERNLTHALSFITDPQHDSYFEEGSAWELIPIITKYINQKTYEEMPDVVDCCKELLLQIANKAHPEECLLEFIDYIERAENNVLFKALIEPMSVCLKKKVHRGNFLMFCLNSIGYHLSNQTLPAIVENEEEIMNLEKKNNELNYKQVIELYSLTRNFYKPFVVDINKKLQMSQVALFDSNSNERQNLVCFIMQIIDKPLVCFDQSITNHTNDARSLVENLIHDLSNLMNNLLIFLEYAELREIEEHCKPKASFGEDVVDIYLLENKIPTISMGALYYSIYGEGMCLDKIPCVYSNTYLFQNSLYLSIKLLEAPHSYTIQKGLKLVESILSRLCEFDIPTIFLELSINEHFVKMLASTIVYCNEAKFRQLGLKVLKSYISKFNWQGRYLLFSHMCNCIKHSGLLGFLITELKDVINNAMSTQPMPVYFCGGKLACLLKVYCHLPEGSAAESLLAVSDHMVAALNLLRFLVIRDKENITGIWNCIAFFENNFLEPLGAAIDLSRMNCKIEQNRTSEENVLQKDDPHNNLDIELTVRGKKLVVPEVDNANTSEHINKAFTALDMMESLLLRLKECIHDTPHRHQYSKDSGIKGIWSSQISCFSADNTNDSTSSDSENSSTNEKAGDIRNNILSAALPFVIQHGWTKNAISAGAETIGYPGIVHGMFPKGGVELIQYFYVTSNQNLVDTMKEKSNQVLLEGRKKKEASLFVQEAVETRLRMIVPYLDKWPQAIGIMSLPPNVPTTLANLLTLVDDICYYAGDRSVDFSWYSRRVALAGIYKMTELCLIQDKSVDYEATWQFLVRRIEDADQMHNYLHQSGEVSQVAKEAVTSAFITARNILGLTLGNR